MRRLDSFNITRQRRRFDTVITTPSIVGMKLSVILLFVVDVSYVCEAGFVNQIPDAIVDVLHRP